MNSRNFSLDILKLILAIFVVALHCQFFYEYNQMISYLTVQGLFRIAVPTFFLINGYFFSNAVEHKNVKEWMIRVFVLYAVWLVIYSPLWFEPNMKSIILDVFIGYYHLWYINAMLLSGALLILVKRMNVRSLLVLVLTLFISGVAIQYLGNYHVFETEVLDKISNFTFSHRNFLFLGFPFFAIGYLFKTQNWHNKLTQKQTLSIVILGFGLLIFESYLNYSFTGEGVDNLFSLLLVCPFLFVYTINLKTKNTFHSNTSKTIAMLSTGIYLLHPWIIEIITSFSEFNQTFLTLLTILGSLLTAMILIKINEKVKFIL